MHDDSLALAARGVPVLERPGHTIDTRYKIMFLQRLLDTGRLDYNAFLAETQQTIKGIDMILFQNAFRVIKNYCENPKGNVN